MFRPGTSVRCFAVLAIAALALLLGGCATPPPPGTPFVVRLTPTPPAGGNAHATVLPVRVDDVRDLLDRARIGETYAPAMVGVPPPVTTPAVATGLVVASLALPPQPTGKYLVVDDPGEVARAVEQAMTYALLAAGRAAPEPGPSLEAVVRSFWMRPSWTTSCDIAVDVRIVGPGGAVRWEAPIAARAEKFEGWFTVEAFERVARMALDQLVDEASNAFRSAAFGAAIGPGG